MTVYAVCEPIRKTVTGTRPVDLSSARKYGEIQILVPHSQSILAPVQTVRTLKEKLKTFNDDDYILPLGDPALIATVSIIAAQINGGKVAFLKWDKHVNDYNVVRIDATGRAL
jgi:hypothetical protein